jgi:hypothetical protein
MGRLRLPRRELIRLGEAGGVLMEGKVGLDICLSLPPNAVSRDSGM